MKFLPGKSGPAGAPLHTAGELGLVPSMGREHWWGRLTEPARRRIAASAGPTVEWWACDEDDLPYAVVLGANALVVWDPAKLTAYRYVRRSLAGARVRERLSTTDAGGDLVADPAPPVDLGLAENLRGFLGNLPAEAQQRLQQPFLGDDRVVHGEFFYYGSETDMDIWCYLAGRATITFVAGHRKARPGTVTWDLTCYNAPLEASR